MTRPGREPTTYMYGVRGWHAIKPLSQPDTVFIDET